MTGSYEIDGFDWYDKYGVIVSKGSDYLLRFPDSKPVYSYDWPDENGTEVDLSERRFKQKTVPFEIALVADSKAQFWERHIGLFNLLASPGIRRVYVAEFERSFYLYYDKCTGFERLTRIQEVNKIGMRGTLEFIEPLPSQWKQFTYMIDKDKNYLVGKDGSRILL